MKRFIVSASLCVCGLACAQSSVTMYGVLDAGLVRDSGGIDPITKITGGVAAGSRLGFKGNEDLGGGAYALFLLESGTNLDTGAMGQGGLLFGRQAFVGIGSKDRGTLTLGRQYSPQYLTAVLADPFVSGTAADSKNLIAAAGSVGRLDNSVKYVSPVWACYNVELVYAAGEVAGAADAGSHKGAALAYGGCGALAARWAYHVRNNDSATVGMASTRNMLIAATYDVGVVRYHAAYGQNRGPFSSPLRNTANPFGYAVAPTAASLTADSDDVLLGITYRLGGDALLASLIHKNDKERRNQDATQLAIGYRHALSKRTDLYAVLAHIRNRNGASYTAGNATESGTGNQAWNLGVRHTF